VVAATAGVSPAASQVLLVIPIVFGSFLFVFRLMKWRLV